jgi:hypothetical protein
LRQARLGQPGPLPTVAKLISEREERTSREPPAAIEASLGGRHPRRIVRATSLPINASRRWRFQQLGFG